jgi:hypothetical protein
MDSPMSRLQRARMPAQPPLLGTLRRKRQQWLDPVRARSAPAWAGLHTALGFAARQAVRWGHFLTRPQGDASYPWESASLEFFFPLLLRPDFLPMGLSRLPTEVAEDTRQASRPLARALPMRPRLGQSRQRRNEAPLPSQRGELNRTQRTATRMQRPWRGTQRGSDPLLPNQRREATSAQMAMPLYITRAQVLPAVGPTPRELHLARLPVYQGQFGNLRTPSDSAGISEQPAVLRPTTALRLTSGTPLAPRLRARLEPLMGFALGGVRLHTDSAAASLAFRLRAHAFTVGPHIFFAAGQFQPQTRQGLALLAHELVHVGQQPDGVPWLWGRLRLLEHRALERAAHDQAHAVLTGNGRSAFAGRTTGSVPMGRHIGDLSGVTASIGDGGTAFSPLVLSYASRTLPVVPLRQETTAGFSQAPAAVGATGPAIPPALPAPEGLDPEQLAQQIYAWIQRRQRLERERRGIQQWH